MITDRHGEIAIVGLGSGISFDTGSDVGVFPDFRSDQEESDVRAH
jgi:hypothetical protein